MLNFGQDWTQRSSTQIISAESSLRFGLPVLGATINSGSIPDGRFFSWIGQFQVVESLGNGIITIARVGGQLTPNSLLPLEQFSIGGIDTIRGYRTDQRVGDNGAIAQVEVRFPLVNKPESIGVIQIGPFFDVGRVWNNGTATIENPRTLVSTGLGLHWNISDYFSATLNYGIRLNPVTRLGDDLQDNGVTFSLYLKPFSF